MLRMSALTKTTAKKTRKKPATRSVNKAVKVGRPKSNVAKGRTKKRLRGRLSAVPKVAKKTKGRRLNTLPKGAKSSARKPNAGRKSKASEGRIKRSSNAGKRLVAGTRKAPSQRSKGARSRQSIASKSRRPQMKSHPGHRRKASTLLKNQAAKRGRPSKERLKGIRLKGKLQQRKENERLKKQRAKEREKLAKLREQEKLRKRKDIEHARKQREQERLRRQREQTALRAVRAKELQQRVKDEEKRKKQQERDSKRQAEIRAREEERRRGQLQREEAKRAKEEERQRQKAEREAEREQARRQKEEERAKRDAEREAYRKAKEAERERLRATREAQKRALEGRIAEATRNANKLGGGRSTTTRFYSPGAIPNQSGTTRRVSDANTSLANSTLSDGMHPSDSQVQAHETGLFANGTLGTPDETPRIPTPPERPLPTAESVEERFRIIEERLKEAPADFRHGYQEALDMSWIYHDSALEGVVYTFQELRAAIDQGSAAVADSSLQPVVEEVRRHKAAIDLVREMGEKKRAPITVDVIRKIYLTLHPEEGDIKTVKYRRDIPQHRLYFHEYAHPEKIQHKVRQIVDWLNGPEPKKLKSPIRVASRAHYELLRVFPFQSDSGKVARLFMNLLLLRAGHPPAIVHSTERQRYYEALRGALPTLIQMVTESILNGLVSIEKLLDDQEIKLRTNPA